MKKIFLIGLTFGLIACSNHTGKNSESLQMQIDSLQIRLNDNYKPGFGEFMSNIQIHHAKLWFAGKGQNWKLAEFEVTEMKESLDGIKKYCTERPETRSIGMIEPAIDSINVSIQKQNLDYFKGNFILLTNTCNSCHKATNHEFNFIKIPDAPPFSNQIFEVAR